MITNIVVHPKGATHKDRIGYFCKKADLAGWMFWCPLVKVWGIECLRFDESFYKPIR